MKLIIAGSRDFKNYELLCERCDEFLIPHRNDIAITIVSGGARGADGLGEKYAREMNYKLMVFPANWNQHGKKAGVIRNEEMAKCADALIAFWDGESRGTKNMIGLAKRYKLLIKVVDFKNK